MDFDLVPPSLLDGEAFTQQYAGVYFSRLVVLRKYVNQALLEKWGAEGLEIVPRIGAVTEQQCMVVGTVCKGAKVSSEGLRQYLSELNLDVDLKDWRQPAELTILEDESARLRLVSTDNSSPLLSHLVTGMVVGVKGTMTSTGDLLVEDLVFPKTLVPPPLPRASKQDQFVACMSGLEIGGNSTDLNKLMRLRDFLSSIESSLAKVLIAGNIMALPEAFDSTSVLDDADTILASLASFVHVDAMPGPLDPTLGALPQPPIHGALMPRADMFDTFRFVPNPHKMEVEGVKFLGTSGQPIRDIMINTGCTEAEALALTLKARCLVPTAPDSVMCHSKTPDSMLIDGKDPPHILFAGCTNDYSCRKDHEFTLLTIPSFSSTSKIILLNLTSLESKAVSID